MTMRIPLFKILWDEADIEAVTRAIKEGGHWAIGENVALFEEKIAEYLGSKYCVTFNSGTSALHAILLAYGVGPGDEVIVPSFTFIATANAALYVGARPVFADIEEKTLGLDPDDVRSKITEKTKAIIPVHYAGCSCLIEELGEIAQHHNLILIEDAAEALGASVNDKKVGTFGNAGVISFCQNKVATTGEGGALLTDSADIWEKLKLVRSHGRSDDSDYFSSSKQTEYVSLGYNFRMSNITAALGISQLDKLDRLIELRRKNALAMSERLSKVGQITAPTAPHGFYHVYQMYTIAVKNGLRDSLMQHLSEEGISTKVNFTPVHQTYLYSNELEYDCQLSVTENMAQQVLTLPMYPTLASEEIDCIASAVEEFFELATE